MKTVKASMVINQRRERSAPHGRHCRGGSELAEGVITANLHSRSADGSSSQPRCNKFHPTTEGCYSALKFMGFEKCACGEANRPGVE